MTHSRLILIVVARSYFLALRPRCLGLQGSHLDLRVFPLLLGCAEFPSIPYRFTAVDAVAAASFA
jgi:hypothetical protein